MDLTIPFDDELARRLSLPLAKLYRRAHNAKTPFDRHQAAYFLWEASLRLLASAAVVAYAEQPGDDPDLAEALKKLARPSLGDWWSFVRRLAPVLADAGDPGFAAVRAVVLDRARDDLPRAAELDVALCEVLGMPGGSKARVRVSDLFDRLVRYRNREIGHGAVGRRPDEFYARVGRVLLPGVSELLGRVDMLAGRRLVYVESVDLQKTGQFLIGRYDLTGESGRRIESLERPVGDAARLPRPKQVYLDATNPRGAVGTDVDGQPAVLVALRPLLVYDPVGDDVLFLNSRRSRRRCEYLCFTTGDCQELDELEGEQRALLARVLGSPFDESEFNGWAEPNSDGAGEAPEARAASPTLRRVGEFELLSELGHGNMGKVYRAWQPSLGRQVALKTVSRPDDAKAKARFRREIRALGRVDHPNLVKIFTSGFDEEPCYYTMELVEGASLSAVSEALSVQSPSASGVDVATWRGALSTACEEARRCETSLSDLGSDLSGAGPAAGVRQSGPAPVTAATDRGYVRQVVDLVRQVALAAHELHAAGVVHRDVKPGNIMLTADGRQAVLMDLGLAQLADDVEGRLTRTRQFVGTLRYASPEQVLSVGEVDCRSDVYSLGATLWELLTLRPLYGATDDLPTPELMRRITSTEPGRIRRYHPGIAADLEAIVQKCLEKDPARRYSTAQELADDLARWLGGGLVLAQPLTTRYVLGKFVRRHRWPVATAAAVALLAAAGASLEFRRVGLARDEARRSATRMRRINEDLQAALRVAEERRLEADRVRNEAVAARAEATRSEGRARRNNEELRLALAEIERRRADAVRARGEAEGARARVRAVNQFLLNDLLAQASPEHNPRGGGKVTVEEALDRAATRVGTAFPGQAEERAEVRRTIAETYHALGAYAKSEEQFRRALEDSRTAEGPDHPSAIEATQGLAHALFHQEKLVEGEPLARKVLEFRRRTAAPDDPTTLDAMGNLGQMLDHLGKYDEAEALFREQVEGRRRVDGAGSVALAIAQNNLGYLLKNRGRPAEAEPLLRESVENGRKYQGEEGPETLSSMENLGQVLRDQGKLDEAERLLRRTLEAKQRVLGPDHPYVAFALHNLAATVEWKGDLGQAEQLYRRALECHRRSRAADHPELLMTTSNLAGVLYSEGKLAEAESMYREALRGRIASLGPEHRLTLDTMSRLGWLLKDRGKPDEAESLLRRAFETSLAIRGFEPDETATAMNYLAGLLRDRGRLAEVERLYRLRMESLRRESGLEAPATLSAMNDLALSLIETGRSADAEPLLREVLQARRKATPNDPSGIANAASSLGWALNAMGRGREAEPVLREALEIRRTTMNGHWATANSESLLGESLRLQRRFDEAEPLLLRSATLLMSAPGAPAPRVRQALGRVVGLYDAWARPDQAKEWRVRLMDLDFPADPFMR